MESPARPSVLVVADDRAVRDSLERALRVVGYDVEVAADGAAGLAAVHDRHPDVVVLDVMLPVVDGLTACRRLRADGNRVPVLMLTARDALGDRPGDSAGGYVAAGAQGLPQDRPSLRGDPVTPLAQGAKHVLELDAGFASAHGFPSRRTDGALFPPSLLSPSCRFQAGGKVSARG